MRLLSIDLPWSSDEGLYGFAWVDLSPGPAAAVETEVVGGGAADAERVFNTLGAKRGRFDVILVDQPLGGVGAEPGNYRNVERAFANSSFINNQQLSIQAPRFQPGAAHAASGLLRAAQAKHALGAAGVVVVESFPQLSIPPLIEFAARGGGQPVGCVESLKAHKEGAHGQEAGRQLVGCFTSWTGRRVNGAAANAAPDAVDAMLALLPLLAVLAPWPQSPSPVWLLAFPSGSPPLPGNVSATQKDVARARWMSPLEIGKLGPPGIRNDGLLSPLLPGWPPPTAPLRGCSSTTLRASGSAASRWTRRAG